MTTLGSANRLLCIYQHAPTRGGPGFYRHHEYFAELVRRGWRVDLVSCAVDYLTGRAPERYAGRPYVRETIDGIDHHWTWAVSDIHRSRRRRALNYVTFTATAVARALTLERPSVVWASSPPLPIGAVGELAAARFRVPWIFEIRDLWPESAVSVGWLDPDSTAYHVLERMAHRFASRADHVFVPTPGLERDAYRHGAKVVSILPGVVQNLAVDESVRQRVRSELSVAEDDLVFAYVGAQGVANGLDVLLDAAVLVADDKRIRFVLAGDGSDHAHLERRVDEQRIGSVTMLGVVPRRRVPELLAAADVCVHVLRGDPVFRAAQPTKVLEYFGAHRPFITTVDGLPRSLAEASGGGYAPSAELLADEIRRWASLSPEERARRGEQGYRYGRKRFGLDTTVDRLERILGELTGRGDRQVVDEAERRRARGNERSGAGVEPTQPGVARPHRF